MTFASQLARWRAAHPDKAPAGAAKRPPPPSPGKAGPAPRNAAMPPLTAGKRPTLRLPEKPLPAAPLEAAAPVPAKPLGKQPMASAPTSDPSLPPFTVTVLAVHRFPPGKSVRIGTARARVTVAGSFGIVVDQIAVMRSPTDGGPYVLLPRLKVGQFWCNTIGLPRAVVASIVQATLAAWHALPPAEPADRAAGGSNLQPAEMAHPESGPASEPSS